MNDTAFEVNFDVLVGPTHNYAGLAYGNIASQRSRHIVSNPRAAALEGLAKMKVLADLGVKQAVLPPQERPDMVMLRRLGFSGDDAHVLEEAHRIAPDLLAACCSASSMWAANTATISPSSDSMDRKVHLTPANLSSQFHRSIEAATTSTILRAVFPDASLFAHHPPLPATPLFADEGAANHMRLSNAYGQSGIEVFVYGRSAASGTAATPSRFPARQTLQASQAIARVHQLGPRRVLFIQQNPACIDAGVFHNDVIAVSNLNVLLCHEMAFLEGHSAIDQIAARFKGECGGDLHVIVIEARQLSVADAVDSYLFNSQLVSLPDGTMVLLAQMECQENRATRCLLDELPSWGTPIRQVQYVSVRQSMSNGGGPSCLRLRVVLTPEQLAQTLQSVFLTPDLYDTLCSWVQRCYRDKLAPSDLTDPRLLEESRSALDQLTQILSLGPIYTFQR